MFGARPLRLCELLPELELGQPQPQPQPPSSEPSEATFPESGSPHRHGHSSDYNSNPNPNPNPNHNPNHNHNHNHNYNRTFPSTPGNEAAAPFRSGRPTYRVPLKAATPRSCRKKSTPLRMRFKTPKKTPTRRTTPIKGPLFSPDKYQTSKYSNLNCNLTEQHSQQDIVFTAPFPKNSHNGQTYDDKHNEDKSFGNVSLERVNVSTNTRPNQHYESSTPRSEHFSSNSILKECRDNNGTPFKFLPSEKKYETPSQNAPPSNNKMRTPLFPTKRVPTFGSHYKPIYKESSRELFSLEEKENSPLHLEFQNKLQFETSTDNHPIDSSSSQRKTNKYNAEPSELKVHKYQTPIRENIMMKSSSFLNDAPRTISKLTPDHSISPPQEAQLLHRDVRARQKPHSISPDILNKPLEYNKPHFYAKSNDVQNFPTKLELNENLSLENRPCTPSIPVTKDADINSNVDNSPQLDNILHSNNQEDEFKTMKQFKTIFIRGKCYTILGKLGSGGSSDVLKVMDAEDSSMYAVKCVNLSVNQSIAESYVNEIKLLKQLQGSDRVITMYNYEFIKQQKILYVLLEMGDVDLSSLLKSYRIREKSLPFPILIGYWTEMLTAVNHIHQNGIIHSDLKPANFLLVHGRLKLIDFGIASSLNMDATSVMKDATMGTFNYISPEAIAVNNCGNATAKISYKSDVWSLGCILYSMIYGRTPFSHLTNVYGKIAALLNPNQVIEYPSIKDVPQVLMKALQWCLTYDVKKRPSVQDLINLPYIHSPGSRSPSEQSEEIPMPIMAKIKSVLTESEWKIVAKVFEGARN
ncbi:dual specificity protein kinase monopolar spindle 1 [Arctopsyche grandis]|uniref:dual specificity protein kinase monopolar spindle 1 n=1 Tax=Arctopsyche grandis TaxID=121162 RepID=UPI00406D6EF8